MARDLPNSSLYMGLVIARSSEEPVSDPAALFYTVQVEEQDGVIEYENVAPPLYKRWPIAVGVDIVPFEIGADVLVGIRREGSEETLVIMESEVPHAGDCNG